MRKSKGRLLSLLVLCLAAFGVVAVGPSAHAATIGNMYISFPRWLGNCPNGDSVTAIWATDGPQTWNGDAGDDLIYGKVYLNQVNSIQYTLYCKTSWRGGYYQPGVSMRFTPTRNGQTIWVGPLNWTRN